MSGYPGPCAPPSASGATARGTLRRRSPSSHAGRSAGDGQNRRQWPNARQAEPRTPDSEHGGSGGGPTARGALPGRPRPPDLGRPPPPPSVQRDIRRRSVTPDLGHSEGRGQAGGCAARWARADGAGHADARGKGVPLTRSPLTTNRGPGPPPQHPRTQGSPPSPLQLRTRRPRRRGQQGDRGRKSKRRPSAEWAGPRNAGGRGVRTSGPGCYPNRNDPQSRGSPPRAPPPPAVRTPGHAAGGDCNRPPATHGTRADTTAATDPTAANSPGRTRGRQTALAEHVAGRAAGGHPAAHPPPATPKSQGTRESAPDRESQVTRSRPRTRKGTRP